MDIIYFSNHSGNTKRFVEKLGMTRAFRIPIKWDVEMPFVVEQEYILFVPTYGSGNDGYSIPASVKKFLNIKSNRELLRGVVGFGNKNFGDHYCHAAVLISQKTGVPVLGRIELFGTPEDVERIRERLENFNDTV